MKVEMKSYQSKGSLIYSIAFLVIGALLFTNSDTIIKWLSYIIGTVLVIYGITKVVKYGIRKQKDLPVSSQDLAIGITLIVIGILCFFLAGVIETAFRLIIGAWILFSGINRLISALNAEDLKGKHNVILIVVAALLIVVGLYILLKSNLVIKAIGLLIIAYAAIDIAGYIFTQAAKYDESPDAPIVIEAKQQIAEIHEEEPVEVVEVEEPKKKSTKKKTTAKKTTTKKKQKKNEE